MRSARTEGYTLLDAITVMAVICIATTLGLPSFRDLVSSQRRLAATHQLSTAFALARNSAIRSGVPIGACPSRGDGACRDDSDWSHGWIVFRDPDRRGQPAAPSSILSQSAAPASGALTLLSNRGRPAIRFLPDGRSAGSNLTVRICERGRLRATVVVNNAGRVRTAMAKGRLPCTMPD